MWTSEKIRPSIYAELVNNNSTSFVKNYFNIDVKIFVPMSEISVGTKANFRDTLKKV